MSEADGLQRSRSQKHVVGARDDGAVLVVARGESVTLRGIHGDGGVAHTEWICDFLFHYLFIGHSIHAFQDNAEKYSGRIRIAEFLTRDRLEFHLVQICQEIFASVTVEHSSGLRR
ncbi:MAG TPA: hypothetical protein VIX37_00560 [Candidatus Sulfotelmatobacter sp.]